MPDSKSAKQPAKTAVSQGLNQLLADYQVLYQKLRNYHWNVSGPMFFGRHAKFEELYTDAALKVDEIAERVLSMGGRPVSTLKGQLALARLEEDAGTPTSDEMVRTLQGDLECLNGALRVASAEAGKLGDVATANLLDGYADGQEKTVWMLRAFLAA